LIFGYVIKEPFLFLVELLYMVCTDDVQLTRLMKAMTNTPVLVKTGGAQVKSYLELTVATSQD